MIYWFFKNKQYTFIFLLHAIVAGASLANRFFLIGWFYFAALSSAIWIFRRKPVDNPLTFIIVYLASLELMGRIVNASPYMPYETSKYLLFILLLYGIVIQRFNRGVVGIFMLLLLLPAFFYDMSGMVNRRDLVLNLLGPVNVALSVVYFFRQKFSPAGYISLLRLLFLPCFMVLFYSFFKMPSFEDVEFRLGANFAAAGGFGTNQVSTVLGLGMFLSFLFYYNKWPLSGFRTLDLFLVFAFAFQGFLTFSRGGMLVALLSIIFYVYLSSNWKQVFTSKKNLIYLILAIVLIYAGFIVVNNITGGKLALRYQGQTEGTLAGTKQLDIDVITSNRYSVLLGDVELFLQNPILGTGAASSRFLRPEEQGTLTHVEFSRLLAEHGLPGLLYFILYLFIGVKLYKTKSFNIFGNIRLILFFIALLTTFHSATRTFVTPLLTGLSVITISGLPLKLNNE